MKRVWTNLRRTYRRMRKMQKKDPMKAKRWQFLDTMSFLRNHSCSSAASDCDSESSSSPDGLETFSQGGNPANDEVEPLSSEQKVEITAASNAERTAMKRKEDRGTQLNGHWTVRDLIQVSVPEIDRLINTKQREISLMLEAQEDLRGDRPSAGHGQSKKPYLYRINLEDIEDNLTVELAKVYDKMDAAREEVKGNVDYQRKLLEDEISSVPPQVIEGLKKKYGGVLSSGEILLLKRLAQGSCSKLKGTICMAIFGASLKLRKVYHREAMSLFIKESMQSGQLQVLLDAYDDFVYYRKAEELNNVEVVLPWAGAIDSCDAETKASFTIFVAVIERYADTLKLSCPEPRLRRDEYDERQIDEFFDEEKKKKKPKFDIEYLAQRISSRTTRSKEALETVLSAAEEAYEKAFKEQEQVEMEYEEFISQKHLPHQKKRRYRRKSSAKRFEQFNKACTGDAELELRRVVRQHVEVRARSYIMKFIQDFLCPVFAYMKK
ncbi:hypothetical protein OSTOST_04481 [Ostertagia ostertagi]